MFKTFLLNFLVSVPPNGLDRKTLQSYLDETREIKNWLSPYAGMVLIVCDSNTTATFLMEKIHSKFPQLKFAVVEMRSESSNGWVSKEFWEMLKNPIATGRWN